MTGNDGGKVGGDGEKQARAAAPDKRLREPHFVFGRFYNVIPLVRLLDQIK